MRKMTVLIIEDKPEVQDLFHTMLHAYVDLTQVYTIEQARVALKNGRFDLATFDGLVPRSAEDPRKALEDMVELVEVTRSRHHMYLMAASDFPDYCEALMNAGCDIKVHSKSELPHVIKKMAASFAEQQLPN